MYPVGNFHFFRKKIIEIEPDSKTRGVYPVKHVLSTKTGHAEGPLTHSLRLSAIADKPISLRYDCWV